MNPGENNEFLKGVNFFNNHDFFDAHDTFEAVWHEVHGPAKEAYQGLVQLAIGYYHFCFGNLKGAESMLTKGLIKCENKKSHLSQLNIDEIILKTEKCLIKLKEIQRGENELKTFNIEEIPKILYRR